MKAILILNSYNNNKINKSIQCSSSTPTSFIIIIIIKIIQKKELLNPNLLFSFSESFCP